MHQTQEEKFRADRSACIERGDAARVKSRRSGDDASFNAADCGRQFGAAYAAVHARAGARSAQHAIIENNAENASGANREIMFSPEQWPGLTRAD